MKNWFESDTYYNLGFLPKVGLDLAGEAATETGQEVIKKKTLGYLNPNRDTSGDMADYLNSAAGGALGAGPVAVGSHLAAAGHKRLGVKDDGEVGDVLDKGAKAPQDASVAASVGRKAREAALDPQANAWAETLQGNAPGFEPGADGQIDAQHAALIKELGGRAAAGDAAAQQHLDALSAMDLNDPIQRYDDTARRAAADHILGDGQDHEGVLKAYKGRKLNEMVAPGDLGGGKVTAMGDDVHPVDDPAGRAKAKAQAEFRQRTKLVGETLATNLPANLKPVAMDLGADLMEFGAKSRAKGIGKQEMQVAQRMAQQLVKLYGGPQAETMLERAAFHAEVEGTPLYKEVRSRVILAANPSERIKAEKVSRATAADELAKAVPPIIARRMAKKDGADLSDAATRLHFLDTIESVFNGDGQFNEAALTREFGEKAVAAMRDIVVVQPLERRAEAEVEAPKEIESGGEKTAAATESDETGVKGGEEEGADWERQGAEKAIENAPGSRDYTFFGGRSASGAEGKHPFVPDAKSGTLPGLMLRDSVDKSTGINSLENLKSKLFEKLGGHDKKSPKTSVLLKQLAAGLVGPPQPAGVRHEVNLSADADSVVPGDLAVGGTRIRTTSAKSVMDHHKVPPTERVEIMRNYLARMKGGKVVLSRDDPTVQQIQTITRRIAKLEKTTPKELVLAVGPNGALAKENPAHAELLDLKAQREEIAAKLAAKIGVDYTEGMTVAQMADAYFSGAHLVVAEQMAEKDQLRVMPADVIAWARLGQRYLKRTDLAGAEARAGAKAAGMTPAQIEKAGEGAANKMAAEMNLLRAVLPGHGGVLDRLDALLPTVPLALMLVSMEAV